MSNTFASVSNAASILKNWYQGPVISQFNDEIPFYKAVEKGSEKWAGLQVVRPVKVRRNPGIGATSDGGTLPAIGKQGTAQAIIAAKYNYLRCGMTGPMIKSSQGDRAAFISIMDFEMEQGLNDLKWDFDRQLYWNGDGTLATVSANAVATNVITATGRESTENGNKFLDVGMVVDIVSSGTVIAQGLEITALTGTTTATITLSSNVTCSANDVIVRSGAYNQEVQGMLYTLSNTQTSSIYSIDRSTYPQYQSNVVNAAGGQLTLDLLQQTWNQGKTRGGAKYDYIACDYDTERYYNKLLVANKRFVNKVVGDGTFSDKNGSYLEFGGIPVVPGQNCPTRMFFIDSRQWKKYVLAELEWADETGSYMIAQVSADSFELRLRLFANFFCEKPSAQAAIRNYISP